MITLYEQLSLSLDDIQPLVPTACNEKDLDQSVWPPIVV